MRNWQTFTAESIEVEGELADNRINPAERELQSPFQPAPNQVIGIGGVASAIPACDDAPITGFARHLFGSGLFW
jgi:hypothetical protein